MTTSAAPLPKPRRPWTRGRIATHAFLAFMAIRWGFLRHRVRSDVWLVTAS